MKDVFAYELISAYFDGELSDDARAEAERLLVENVEYRRWFQQLKAMRGALAGLPSHRLEADFAQKVLRKAELATLRGEVANQDNPPQSAAGPAAQGAPVQSTGAATRNGRSAVRWDAPLWIAVAAAVCIYVSLANRDSVEQPAADQVALQRESENRPMASVPAAQSAVPSAAPSAAPSPLEQAEPAHAAGDEAQTAGSAAYHLHEKQPPETRHLRESADLGLESSATMEAAPPGYGVPSQATFAKPSANEANGIRRGARLANPARARSPAGPLEGVADVAPQAQPAAMPQAPAARRNQAVQADRAEALAAPPVTASLSVADQDAVARQEARNATTAMMAHGDVLIYETPGDAQALISQFEAALTAESIVLAAPPEQQVDDNALAKGQSSQPAEEEREAMDKNRQRAQTLGPAQEEVRVYVVEASDEQLARLMTRLRQLPDTSLRQSQLPAGASDTDGTGLDKAMSSAQAVENRSGNNAQINGAQAKDEQPQGPASRRAVFILRAPREAP